MWSREAFLYAVVSHTFAVLLYVRGKSSLISHIRSILAVLLLDDTSQGLVELRPHTQGITERFSPYRKYHELLHSQPVTSMGPPIDHIKSLNEGTDNIEWDCIWICAFGENCICAQGLTGTGRTRSLFPARSAIWRYRGTPFSAAPALHMASDTPRIELAPNLAGRNTEARHMDGARGHWCGNMSSHIWATTVRDAYICCQCRPNQSSRCPVSPAPAHWSPDRKPKWCLNNSSPILLRHFHLEQI